MRLARRVTAIVALAIGRDGVAAQARLARDLLAQDTWFVANEAARMSRLEALMQEESRASEGH